jgi:hypothetical protein
MRAELPKHVEVFRENVYPPRAVRVGSRRVHVGYWNRIVMMRLVDTPLEPPRLQRNEDDFAVVRQIAESGRDYPVLMLNMNRYKPDSGFPDRGAYHEYITGLGPFLEGVGGEILWRFPVLGQAVGNQKVDEIIACWYPLHRVFLHLYDAPGAVENFRRKGLCVEYAVIHRCPGNLSPFAP